jgi:ribonuclease Z
VLNSAKGRQNKAVQITFLGTSSGVPTRSRNVSSVALRLPQRAQLWLFDCGEGTQHQILRSELKVSQLSRIFITHMHGDHIFGLMGLLASCGLAGSVDRVDIYGPPGLNDYLQLASRHSHTHFSFPIKVHAVRPGIIYEDDEFSVICNPLQIAPDVLMLKKPKSYKFHPVEFTDNSNVVKQSLLQMGESSTVKNCADLQRLDVKLLTVRTRFTVTMQ